MLKKYAAKVAGYLISPAFRPFEIRAARWAGLAVLGWLGVKYG